MPSVLRTQRIRRRELGYDEFHMTTMFRLKALAFSGGEKTPETSRLDQWLFLMQHYGLPTRLLDWTENPSAACFFAATVAVQSERPRNRHPDREYMAVWMLHPIELNKLATNDQLRDFPNTWVQGPPLENFKIAFGTAGRDVIMLPTGERVVYQPTRLPLAVQPSNIAVRVAVQRSCFTVHGTRKANFEEIFRAIRSRRRFLRKYLIHRDRASRILAELEATGISDSTLFPDFEGLARELKRRFFLRR